MDNFINPRVLHGAEQFGKGSRIAFEGRLNDRVGITKFENGDLYIAAGNTTIRLTHHFGDVSALKNFLNQNY